VPGIGKSRLVHELWQQVEDDPELIVWRRGRSLPYGEGIAYWALGEIVKAQAGILESDGAHEAEAKLDAVVAALVPDRGEAAWVERHLRPLTGLPVDETTTPSREEAFGARRRFLEALAEHGPAILVFEDIHWADDDLLDFVDELADRLDSVPLLIVCTARPELLSRRPGWGGGKSNAATALLEQLSDEETARLLGALLERSVLPAETQEALLRRAGGIPLFAEEYARLIAAGEPTIDVPETLQGIVAARIDGLGTAEKALLQDASVLGKVFWTDALAALSASSTSQLDERLRSLERREFVRRERRSAVEGARQYIFLHALVRDTAYGQIPRAARAEKHRRTAEWIAALPQDRAEDRAEMLVHHLESAVEYGEAAGLDVSGLRPLLAGALSDAADRAWALSMAPRAAHLYQRALDAAPPGAPVAALQLRFGKALWRSEGVGSDGERHLEEATEALLASGDREEAAAGMVILARVRWNAGRSERDLRDRAFALVEGVGPTKARCQVLEYVAAREAIEGRGEKGIMLAEEALAIARSLGDQGLEVETLNTLGIARATAGDVVDGIAACRAALELGLEIGAVDTARCYVNTASLEGEYGDLENAQRHRREGLAFARRLGHTAYSDWLEAEVVIDEYVSGAWNEALERAEQLLAVFEDRGVDHYMAAPVRLVRAAIGVAREGTVPRDDLDRALEPSRAFTDPQLLLPSLAEAAWVLFAAGENTAADGLLDEIVAALVRDEAYGYAAGWVVPAALVWSANRQEPTPAAFTAGGKTRWSEVADRLSRGQVVEAADLLGSMGARSLEANARRQAADQLRDSDPDEALRQLDQAAAFWHGVQAKACLRQVEELSLALRPAAS
jgi:tetratricopeptide (TPR) repeat protein